MNFNICFSPTILLLLYKSCNLMYGANAILWFSNFLKIRNWLFRLIFNSADWHKLDICSLSGNFDAYRRNTLLMLATRLKAFGFSSCNLLIIKFLFFLVGFSLSFLFSFKATLSQAIHILRELAPTKLARELAIDQDIITKIGL